jgi:hypothetical protein
MSIRPIFNDLVQPLTLKDDHGQVIPFAIATIKNVGEYWGQLANSRPNGWGILRSVNEYYEGSFRNGFKQGLGIQIYDDLFGSCLYFGFFNLDQCNIQGTCINKLGIYVGQYEMGMKKGIGKFISPDSSRIFEGTWDNELPNGPGKLTVGEAVYEGDWVDGWLESADPKIHYLLLDCDSDPLMEFE